MAYKSKKTGEIKGDLHLFINKSVIDKFTGIIKMEGKKRNEVIEELLKKYIDEYENKLIKKKKEEIFLNF
ncbi:MULTISPECIES: hypothetical protein [unclassified Nitratiruptor]|uniref:hypothetical protein n=1 Tax=unclassified Nitratiruptor TaxID=2624044 RepID=UPI0019166DE4|nr:MULTISPECIES: hypothetical protein [unclassified Nitratiruptor]